MASDRFENERKSLLTFLAKKDDGQCALKDIPRDLTRADILNEALRHGEIELGRQNYSATIKQDGLKIIPPDPKDPAAEKTVEHTFDYRLDQGWSWTNLQKPGLKTVHQMLTEDDKLQKENVVLWKLAPLTLRAVSRVAVAA